jgi:hypothetical protein
MKNIRYAIRTLSAKAIMSFAKETGDGSYSFHLSQNETDTCKINQNPLLQDDMPICFQTMCLIKGNQYRYEPAFTDRETLLNILIYVDFGGIFDRNSQQKKYTDRQKKAEAMFRPEGICLDFGSGSHRYLAFERSGSMSRAAKLSFIREDFYEPLRRRMMLDMQIGKCQLSKLYAYNGLMFTSGHRYEDMSIWDSKRVVVVENPKSLVYEANIVTVTDDGSDSSVRKYSRMEDVADIEVLEFDGEGLISRELADRMDTDFCGQHIHSSFQIRMPYIKGVVHEVDFKSMLSELGVPYIIDLWGNKHKVRDVDLILTKSMFKGYGWMTENGLTFDEYLARCRAYRHALYISGVNQTDKQEFTELNYQFLNTVSMKAEEFRPLDFPDGWTTSPETDNRHWITKATETQYYDYVANNRYRVQYFLSALDSFESSDKQKQLARILQKNHLFVNESIYTSELESKAKKVLEKYALGRLVIAGDNRYLSGDLMRFIQSLVKTVSEVDDQYMGVVVRIGRECSPLAVAYAPGAAYPEGDKYTLLRNPHIARNEEAVVTPMEQVGYLRNKYLSHLHYVVMVDSRTLIPERLGGADFDGDMVKTIADPLLNECVTRNYKEDDFDPFSYQSNIPLLKIPSAEPIIRDANDWQARFEAVRSTFSSRIGQICNAAFDRSIIAYDENSTAAERNRCREETETLAILVGLEIDSAKSGIKPDLTEYLSQKTVGRSIFLKYKDLVNEGDGHEWYEKTLKQKLDAYHDSVDWDAVSSNVERLPHLARRLDQNTPKIKPKPAKDHELFTFAGKDGWKETIPAMDMDYMRGLIADYEEILKRARLLTIERKTMTHRNDIERILYARGQENTFTTDELYNLFVHYDADALAKFREDLTASAWHLMTEEERELFLISHLPLETPRAYFDLFADFRHGGYRVLGDIICDLDDAFRYEETRNHIFDRKRDNFQRKLMINNHKLSGMDFDFKRNIARGCRSAINYQFDPDKALMCAIALGERKFALEVLPDMVEKYAKEVPLC